MSIIQSTTTCLSNLYMYIVMSERVSILSSFCPALCESGTVRLVSESNSYFRNYGRVEVCINQTWNTICDEHWDHVDASVVCSQLGFSANGQFVVFCIHPYFVQYIDLAIHTMTVMVSGALALKGVFTERVWPLTITNITCSGIETNLLECSYSTEPLSACSVLRDASVTCQSICPCTIIKSSNDALKLCR